MKVCDLDFCKLGLKKTQNREEIYNVLNASNIPMTAEEIHEKLSKIGSRADLSTVYRTIKTFEEYDVVRRALEDIDKSVMYVLSKGSHKHYLLCNICSKIDEIDMCPLDDMVKKIEDDKGFVVDFHSLTIRGICSSCSKKEQTSKTVPKQPLNN